MYTQKRLEELDSSNFDFTNFDWKAAKDALCWHMQMAKAEARGEDCPPLPEGYIHPYSFRTLHVLYSMARGRPLVGERGIEQINTRNPLYKSSLQYELSKFQLEAEERAA